jgi:hypothetical protein
VEKQTQEVDRQMENKDLVLECLKEDKEALSRETRQLQDKKKVLEQVLAR